MSRVRFIYILLHIWEIWMLFIAGKKMSHSKTNKEYWTSSLWAFIPYFVVLGLRFGHNIDWNYYCQRYMEHYRMDWNTTEPLYHFTFYCFNNLGIPYFLVISLQVIFFMYSFLLVAKHFRNCLYYVLPLLPVVAQSNDNYIRWYWAISFILIAFYWFLSGNKHILKAFIFFVFGVLVHNGSILLILLFIIYFIGNKKHFPPIFSLSLIFISVFCMDISFMSFFGDMANAMYLLGGDYFSKSNVSHYMLKVSEIAGGGLTSITGIKTFSIISKIITFLSYFPITYWGLQYLKHYKFGILYYNLFLLGAFLNPIFSTVEIFDRYSKFFLIFQAIVAGVVYYNMLIKDKRIKIELKVLCLISMFCCFYPFIRYSIRTKAEYRMMYIWDAGYKEYINTNLYLNEMYKNRYEK